MSPRFPWKFLPLLAVGTVSLAAARSQGAPEARGWRGWDRYQPIMWSTGAPRDTKTWIARLKEIGCTAEEAGRGTDSSVYPENGLGFYVENLVSELAFLHDRRALYDADFQGYTRTHEKRFLTRKPCFDDPAFWEEKEHTLPALVRPHVGNRPLLYDLRDELSIGSFASPMDYCFCPHTLRAFREWLREQYGTLDVLNREWETEFRSWDAVEPLTTYEIKDRERQALAAGRPENYAPWADHRAYMDLSFARALDRMRGIVRKVDPETPVGIEGTQMPSAWGGHDLWRLSQAVDWVEPYDIASSREIFRSFLPEKAPVLGTVFGSDFPQIRLRLWRLLLHGDRGCIIWDDEKSRAIDKTAEGMPVTARGKGLAPLFAELRKVGPEIMGLRRVDDRIAIHYSQASTRAHWMFDSREDKDTWPRRFSSYEASHSRYARVRDSFVRAVEDLGLQYRFVSYAQIERGDLRKEGYRVLLLPQSVALSKEEVEEVRKFVQAGGMVIADNMPAVMDGHCRRLPAGQLDDLFGIRRSGWRWRAKGEAGPVAGSALTAYEPEVSLTAGKAEASAGKVPALIRNRAGKGRAVYLNLDMHDYGRERLRSGPDPAVLPLFRRLLAEGGVSAPVRVLRAADGRSAQGVEVWRYRGNSADYVAVIRNPEFAADSLGAVGYTGNQALEKPEPVRIMLPRKAAVRDVRAGKPLGTVNEIRAELDPWAPLIFKLYSRT